MNGEPRVAKKALQMLIYGRHFLLVKVLSYIITMKRHYLLVRWCK